MFLRRFQPEHKSFPTENGRKKNNKKWKPTFLLLVINFFLSLIGDNGKGCELDFFNIEFEELMDKVQGTATSVALLSAFSSLSISAEAVEPLGAPGLSGVCDCEK